MDFLPNEKEDPISSYMFCIESHFQLDIFLNWRNKTNTSNNHLGSSSLDKKINKSFYGGGVQHITVIKVAKTSLPFSRTCRVNYDGIVQQMPDFRDG